MARLVGYNLKMGKLSTLLLLMVFTSVSMAQDIDIELLVDKPWTITGYLLGDSNTPHGYFINHTIFRSNHEVETINENVVTNSKWSFDDNRGVLTLTAEGSADSSEMKILMLTAEEFRYDVLTTEGMNVTVVMKPYN